jgi:GT2 family glycosyltransferase
VTSHYLHAMLRHSRELEDRDEIAVILPTVRVAETIMSPKQQLFMRSGFYQRESEMLHGYAIGINSGAIMRVAWLRTIGGFSTDFWLDYSDLYVFHQLFLHGARVWYASDAELEHEMTVMDYDRLMQPWRYENFSYAETAFYDLYKGHLENAVHHLRLFVRSIRQRRRFVNPVFSQIAWAQFLYRIKVPRKRRLEFWRLEGLKRRGVGA